MLLQLQLATLPGGPQTIQVKQQENKMIYSFFCSIGSENGRVSGRLLQHLIKSSWGKS